MLKLIKKLIKLFSIFKKLIIRNKALIKIVNLFYIIINHRLFKYFKLILKLLAYINIFLGASVIVAYNGSLSDILINLATLYDNLMIKLHNFSQETIRSLITRLSSYLDTDNLNNKPSINSSNNSLRNDYKLPLEDKTSKYWNFYKSPYFYYPLLTILTGGLIYVYLDNIETFLVTSGIYRWYLEFFYGIDRPPILPTPDLTPLHSPIQLLPELPASAPISPVENPLTDDLTHSNYKFYFDSPLPTENPFTSTIEFGGTSPTLSEASDSTLRNK